MSTFVEPEVSWSQDQMIEVVLNEPDDFLKVRETLTRIGVARVKKRKFISPVIFYTNRVSIISFISKNFLHWTANTLILQLMTFNVVIVLLIFFLTGD